jgi:transcriptional regulator with XRE-family HTH domain
MAGSVYTDEHRALVETLVAARRKSGLRQADLGALVGRDQSYISNIERGERRVDAIEFYKLAKAVQTDPVKLYGALVMKLDKSDSQNRADFRVPPLEETPRLQSGRGFSRRLG